MPSTYKSPGYEIEWAMRPMPVVLWLLIINTAVFLLQVFSGLLGISFFDHLGLSPLEVRQGFWWQFFTYMFLHGGAIHLLFNLLVLYFFGNEVESALSSKLMARMYLLGGLGGGLLWFVFNIHQNALLVGASGAIYALVAAFATLFPNRPITLLIFFIFPVTILAKYLAIGVLIISILFSLDNTTGLVGHLAHVGGIIVGYLFVKALHAPIRFPKLSWPRHWKGKQSSPHLQVLPSPMKKDEFIQQRIDPILDKIAEQGIQSLTREERRLLDEAKDRLS